MIATRDSNGDHPRPKGTHGNAALLVRHVGWGLWRFLA